MTDDPWRGLRAGRVLDVATGKGQFIGGLVEDLGEFTEIVGVDIDASGEAAFKERFAALPSASFKLADACALPFHSGSFDTVAIGGSLHHLSETKRALSEMLRVLRTGGSLIIAEQRRDAQHGAQLTHREFHEWSEELLGIPHRTYTRSELVQIIRTLNLADVQMVDQHDGSDAHDEAKVARYDKFIEEYLERSRGRPAMIARGKRIRARLHTTGINVTSWVSVLGTKARR